MLNAQREVIYGIRNDAVVKTPIDIVYEMIEEEFEERLAVLDGDRDSDTIEPFLAWTNAYFPIALKAEEIAGLDLEALRADSRQGQGGLPGP